MSRQVRPFSSDPAVLLTVSSRIAEFEQSTYSDVSQAELDALRMEENTWGLLQALTP